DRGRAGRLRSAGERDVPLPGEETGGGIEADPTCAGDVDLRPSMKVGDVLLDSGRTIERLLIRLELHRIARDEAGREAEVAKSLDQEVGEIAAGALADLEGLLAGLDA